MPGTIQSIFDHPGVWRGSDLAHVAAPSLPTGFSGLDAELPGGGWPAGAITEILPVHEGIGELRLFNPVLAALTAGGKWLAWIAPPHRPYAPALAAAGIELARMFIVKTKSERETLWAIEQALASRACSAVLAWPGAARYAELRRLQLAAEGSRTLAVLFRPQQAAAESSPAALRIALDTANGSLALRILKRRGSPLDRPVLLAGAPLASCRPAAARAAAHPPPLPRTAAAGPAERPQPHLA